MKKISLLALLAILSLSSFQYLKAEQITQVKPEKSTPENGTENTPEDATEDTPEDATEETPEDAKKETPKETPESELSNQASEPAGADATQTVSSSASTTAAGGFTITSAMAPLAGLGIAVGVGGGGGSSSSSSSTSTYSSTIEGAYATEYNAQAGLAYVNALSLNDYGYTGDGVLVGVVDSGIDSSHAEFDGKTIYGTDFASSGSGYGSDENGHGTHVASTIAGDRDASGMRGVAYDATLYDYKTDNDGDSGLEALNSDSNIASVFNQHVTNNINVSNNSWGLGSSITTYSEATLRASLPNTITALSSAQTNGTLLVFAAGNDSASEVDYMGGLPYRISELADKWIVVGAVNTSGVEASFTNRCGVASAFCVVAPGVSVYAAQANGSYTTMSGTSMATPHVAGVAAALIEKFPSLTAAQIATRILTTASYGDLTGRNGETSANSTTAEMEAIFGQGLVNSTAASASIGNYIYANGNNLNDGQNLGSKKLSLPAGIPASVQKEILKSKFIVFDSFDGARFSVNGKEVFEISNKPHVPLIKNLDITDIYAEKSHAFTSEGERAILSVWAPRFIFTGESNQITPANILWGNSASLFPSMDLIRGQKVQKFSWNRKFNNLIMQPFIRIENKEAQAVSSLGAAFQLELANGLNAITGLEVAQEPLDNGIFSDSFSTGTLKSLELGFRKETLNNQNMFARLSATEVEDVQPTPSSFGFRDARANSWTFGYEINSTWGEFSFGASKPNQLYNGTASIVVPIGRTKFGEIIYTEAKFPINDNKSLERFFAYGLNRDNLKLSLGLVEDRLDYGKMGAAKLDISLQF